MNRKKYSYEDYNKNEPTEDATKFFIVYEGRNKEPNYFEAFNEKLINKKKAFVCHILEEDTGIEGNTPLKLKERVQQFIDRPPLNISITPASDDKFRFVLDYDKHPIEHINELIEFSNQLENSGVYISNYCFEVWLWAHIDDLSKISSAKSSEIKKEFGSIQNFNYPHQFIDISIIKKAIERCKNSDINKDVLIPNQKNSKVYLLIEELLIYSSINLD